MRALAELFWELIYPRKCVFCGKTLEMKSYRGIIQKIEYDYLCNECRSKIKDKYIEEPYCFKCGRQLESMSQEYCAGCVGAGHIYDRGAAVFKYHDDVKKSIYRFKYKSCKLYGEFYGQEMAKKYMTLIKEWKPDVIIPIPIHKSRMKKRGYNQAELIGKTLSERTGIPIDKDALFREKKTKPQKELSKDIRAKNVENAFKVSRNVVKYKKVILVDDIYTTGATINSCANVLKKAGVRQVYFISICIGAGI